MMKKLILILTILFSVFNSFSQNPSNPVAWYEMSNAFTVGGRFRVPIDTTANPGGGPRYPFISPGGMIGFKTNSFYGHNGSSWQRFLYESDLLANAGITKTGNIFQLGSATPGVINSWFGGRYLTGISPYSGWIQLDSLPIIINNSFNINGSGAAPSWVTQSFPSNFYSGKTFNINTPDVTTTTRGITLHNMTIGSVYNGTDFLNFRNNSQTPFRSSMVRLQVDFGRTAQTLGAMYFNGGTTPLESPVTMNSNWTLPFNNADSVRRVVLKGWWAHYSTSIQRGTSGNNRDSIEHLVDYLSGQGVNFNRQLKTHISFYSDNEAMGEQRWSLFSQGAGRKLYSQGQAIFGSDTVATPGFAVNIKGKARLTTADSVGSPMNMLTLNRITGAIEVAAVPSGTSSITTGYGINGDGSGGNPVRVDSATLRGDYIRNQYAAREAKRLWVDTVRSNVVRFDSLLTNNIPNQYIPIFVDGRMRGFRTIQHNAVGFRVLQRNASEGFSASDLVYTSTDTAGVVRYAVRWDGRTTIGAGTSSNLIDVYGTAGGFNNTNIRVKTSATNGDSRLIAENSGTGRVFLQATSSSVSILANQGSLLVENLPKFEFMTDGQLASGGTAPFFWKAGGYAVTPQFSVFPSNRVGVNVGTTEPVASVAFQVNSTTAGFLPPRMTATQASAISSPAEGLMVYVTDTNGTFTSKGWWGYNGSAWEKLNN